nr:cytochrome c-type biogenesis protein [uncultured Rhodospira sp.]
MTGAALGLLVALAATPAAAVEPDEMLEDPALEERARVISRDLRCVVCQNESIDESNADMARDMRILVRDRLLEGDSNAEVKQYLVDRYGDYVLLTPPFKPTTYVLWFGPALILVGAAVAAVAYYRHKAKAPAAPPPLTAEEQAQLRSLLAMHGDDTGTSSKPDPKTPKARSKTPRRGGSA